ncbi:MAG: hypothetical protein KC766_37800 [Myxococcales bacterium]|nr:hypothetical protein [Myxococcales bacterium]
MSRIESSVLSSSVAKLETTIGELLRDPDFAEAWVDASLALTARIPLPELSRPVVRGEVREIVGGYHDELQAVATAFGEVYRHAAQADSVQDEVRNLEGWRLFLPHYLDDQLLPIEVWKALRSRDIASISYIALIEGTHGDASMELLAECAELHCKHQRQWLDFYAWMVKAPCPEVVPAGSRRDWPEIFEQARLAELGAQALMDCAEGSTGGFTVDLCEFGED